MVLQGVPWLRPRRQRRGVAPPGGPGRRPTPVRLNMALHRQLQWPHVLHHHSISHLSHRH